MAKIKPVSTFYNGETKELGNIELRSIGDNLSLVPLGGQATIYYELQSIVVNEDLSETMENIITATLDISGEDYDSWNTDPTSNAWILNWAVNKLKLELI